MMRPRPGLSGAGTRVLGRGAPSGGVVLRPPARRAIPLADGVERE